MNQLEYNALLTFLYQFFMWAWLVTILVFFYFRSKNGKGKK